VVLVSDACGQLGLDPAPGGGHLAPVLRSFSVFQERTRQSSFRRLQDARDDRRLAGLVYVHLKQDLETPPLDWIHCEDPVRDDDQYPKQTLDSPRTSFGVWKGHQRLLADIRTDLDVFSDIEAAALMASGYLALGAQVDALLREVPALAAPREQRDWFFTPLLGRLRDEDELLARHLKGGSAMFLRLTQLDPLARQFAWVSAAVVAIVAALALWRFWDREFEFSVGWIAVTVGTIVAGMVVRYALPGWSWTEVLIDPIGSLKDRAKSWLGAYGAWAIARVVVPRLTQRYLEVGRLEALQRKT
jgi:hypothetical protein